VSQRRAYLDIAPGETRGVVTLDGRPEHLILARDEDDPRHEPGARIAARVRKVEPAFASAFVDLGEGLEGLMDYPPDRRPVEGQMLEVEVRAAPRPGKLAAVRGVGPAEAPVRLLSPGPSVADRLAHLTRSRETVTGAEARRRADEAEETALTEAHVLPGGGLVVIETTRALVAVDVDLGPRKGPDPKSLVRQLNLTAIAETARLLRLKGLGGLVVIDLAGRGHDGTALLNAARNAFAADNPGVAFGPVSRFGTLELTVPRRTRAVSEILLEPGGEPSDRTLAQKLVRRAESEAEGETGRVVKIEAGAAVARLAWPLIDRLAERMGARFDRVLEPDWPRDRFEVTVP
jgi:Ribonuclease G/E